MRVSIIGINGLVGSELSKIIENNEDWEITGLGSNDNIDFEKLKKYDIVFLCVDNDVSAYIAPKIFADTFVIDNSSFFRLDPEVNLVVPELDNNYLNTIKETKKVIANPNCSTIQLVIPLKPILDIYGIEEVFVATYQSVSGAGKKALEEFKYQIKTNDFSNKHLPYPIAYNLFPVIGSFDNSNSEDIICTEEKKIILESQKILNSKFKVFPFTVRVPVIRAHSQVVYVKTKQDFNYNKLLDELIEFGNITKALKIWLDNSNLPVPYNVSNTNEVHLARVRKLDSNLLGFWSVSDNLLRGAAYNAYLIAKQIINHFYKSKIQNR
ncbi:MAG: aspartate-semialdehyde dehydrogenase [bacterium]|nr:aspartate-semialdehyde dehydrogenase [bacterium]